MVNKNLENAIKKVRAAIDYLDEMRPKEDPQDGYVSFGKWMFHRACFESILNLHHCESLAGKADTVIHACLYTAACECGIPFDKTGMVFVNTYKYLGKDLPIVSSLLCREDEAEEAVKSIKEELESHDFHLIGGEETGYRMYDVRVEDTMAILNSSRIYN